MTQNYKIDCIFIMHGQYTSIFVVLKCPMYYKGDGLHFNFKGTQFFTNFLCSYLCHSENFPLVKEKHAG